MYNWNKFPWTDYRGTNLDWIIREMKELQESVENLKPPSQLWHSTRYTNIKEITNKTDGISTEIAAAIANGVDAIYFPEGTYSFTLPVGIKRIHLSGAGDNTRIFALPNSGGSFISTTKLDYSSFDNIHFMNPGSYFYKNSFLKMENGFFTHNVVRHCTFENFDEAFRFINTSVIWNTWYDTKMEGSAKNAFHFSSNQLAHPFNANLFVTCAFDTNAAMGFYCNITPAGSSLALANAMINCTIEGNGWRNPAFVETGVPQHAFYNASIMTLYSCYMENNNVLKSVLGQTGHSLTCIGCNFTLEKVPIFYGGNSAQVKFINCVGTETTVNLVTDDIANTTNVNVEWDGKITKIIPNFTYTGIYFDFQHTDHLHYTGGATITQVLPANKSRPSTVWVDKDTTVPNYMSADGKQWTIPANTGVAIVIVNGKLVRIN